MGGDCLNNGCIPSKSFLKSCSVAHQIKTASKYGIKVKGEIEIDFELWTIVDAYWSAWFCPRMTQSKIRTL